MAQCRVSDNLALCRCTSDSCPRRGKCCECVAAHREKDQLPGCFFPPEWEKKYDRSRAAFFRAWRS